MGYRNCGRKEAYPYDVLLDGQPHIIRASEYVLRTLRYGAQRRRMKLTVMHRGGGLYTITASPRQEVSP